MLPIAVDAMGGDKAPGEIVEGAKRAAAELDVPVVLVGRPDELDGDHGLEVLPASEVLAMDADPAKSVRTMKDSSLVRAAEAVRDGKASAMVSAGNTGATMASALLRMGRIKGVNRPAIVTPIPVPGSTPTALLDAGANAECQPEWLIHRKKLAGRFPRAGPVRGARLARRLPPPYSGTAGHGGCGGRAGGQTIMDRTGSGNPRGPANLEDAALAALP